MPAQGKPRRLPRWARALFGLVALLILVLMGIGAHFASEYFDIHRTAAKVEKAADAYRRSGMPWEAKDLAPRPPVRPEENAAPLIRRAMPLLPNASGDYKEVRRIEGLLRAGDLRGIERILRPYHPALDQAVEASVRPRLDFERDWDLGCTLEFHEESFLRRAIYNLTVRAQLLARRGKVESAVTDLRAARRLASLMAQEPSVFALNLSSLLQRKVYDALQHCAAAHATDPRVLKALRAVLDESLPRPSVARALEGEAYSRLADIRNGRIVAFWRHSHDAETAEGPAFPLRRTGFPPDSTSRAYMTRHMQYWTEAKPIIDRYADDPEAFAPAVRPIFARSEESRSLSNEMNAILFPEFGRAGESIRTAEAHRLATRGLLEALLHRARTGAFPKRLQDLPGDWRDPFTDAPLRYKLAPKSLRIYSIGPNRRDEGGVDSREGTAAPSRTDDLAPPTLRFTAPPN